MRLPRVSAKLETHGPATASGPIVDQSERAASRRYSRTARRCTVMRAMSRFLIATLLLILGCARDSTAPAGQYVATANGPVEFEFPAGWRENEKEHPFDLQWVSQDQRMNTGVFLFAKEDLAEDFVPSALFERQVDDLGSKRKNFEALEPKRVVNVGNKTLTTAVFSGEKDSSRDFYRFTLIEFADNPEWLPFVLQVSIPSYWEKNKPVLEGITASARVRSSR
jgi:hypothetical protein